MDRSTTPLIPLLLEAARALLEQSKSSQARASAEQAARFAQDAQEPGLEAECLFVLGRAAQSDGDEVAAREAWSRCLELQETRLLDPLGAARTLSELGTLHRVAGRLEEAREALGRSLQLSSRGTPGPERAAALEQLGIVERRLGSFERAAEHLGEAVRIFAAVGDVARVAGAREKLGNTLQKLGKLDEAMDHYRDCLEVYARAQDRAGLASTHNNIAGTLHQLGRHREAIEEFQKARALFEELGKRKPLAVTLGNLGVICLLVGRADEAGSLLDEALRIHEELGEGVLQAAVLNNLALLRLEAGLYADALVLSERAVELREVHGATEGLVKPLRNKALALISLERFEEAGTVVARARGEAERGESVEARTEVLRLEAEFHLARGRFDEAERPAEAARELGREASPRDEAHALRVLGTIALRRGNRAEARDLLLEAEARYRRFTDPFALGLCTFELGGLFLQAEAFEAAAQRLREARLVFQAFGNRELEWKTLCRLGESEHAVSLEQARVTLEEARQLARQEHWVARVGEVDALERRLEERSAMEPQAVFEEIRELEQALLPSPDAEDALRIVLERIRGRRGIIAAVCTGTESAAALAELGLGSGAEGAFRGALDRAIVAVTSGGRTVQVPGPSDGVTALVLPVRAQPTRAFVVLLKEREVRALRAWLEGATIVLGAALRASSNLGVDGVAAPTPAEGLVGAGTSPPSPRFRGIVGASGPMMRLFRTIEQVAPTTASVLIEGESGTGKELVARAVHEASGRAGAFVAISCPSFPENLIESELFGYERGAFTGASQRRLGQVELAHGGTLFLDEVGDMAMSTQTKLLRFLEIREFLRVGGREPVSVDVRLVAATSRDLQKELAAGRFREDLYHRIKVVPIRLPALRERREDIPVLARTFLAEIAPGAIITDDAIQAILLHPWPGNVRELRNLIQRIAATGAGPVLDVAAVPEEYWARSAAPEGSALGAGGDASIMDRATLRPGETLQARLLTIEGALLRFALERCDWNQTSAARMLGLTESTLRDKMLRFGIRRPDGTRRAGRRPDPNGRRRAPSRRR